MQLASQAMGQRDQDREAKMFRELYQRHVDYMGAMVGHDFEQVRMESLLWIDVGK